MSTNRETFFIDGGWVKAASSRKIEIINASTEETIGTVPEGSETDIDRAGAAARRAFKESGWATCPPAERGEALMIFATEIASASPRSVC
jgi:acyl-CoA reductase-like NAD-dependent aldehyde dehydrogenase